MSACAFHRPTCQQARISFHWEPSRLPWLQSPDVECVEARHVDHNVPIFRFQCELQYGLPLLPSPGGIQRFKFKPRMQTFNKLLQDFGGAEVGEAEAKYVPRTESGKAFPESSQIHHCANVEEAAAWRALRAASAEEAPQDSPVDETWVDNLPANHLMTHLPKSRS